jgi:hypothetical protein
MENLIESIYINDEGLPDSSIYGMLEENKQLYEDFLFNNNGMNIVIDNGKNIFIENLDWLLSKEVDKIYYVDDNYANILLYNGEHLEIKIL